MHVKNQVLFPFLQYSHHQQVNSQTFGPADLVLIDTSPVQPGAQFHSHTTWISDIATNKIVQFVLLHPSSLDIKFTKQ